MQDQEIPLIFKPLDKKVYVLEGTRLLEAASSVGMNLEQPCGGEGTCGKCQVRIIGEVCAPTMVDEAFFSPKQLADGWRLACQAIVVGPATIEVPETSLIDTQQIILTQTETGRTIIADPAVQKQYVELTPPVIGDDRSDAARLQAAFGSLKIDSEMLHRLSENLRQNDYRGTVVAIDGCLVDFEAGDTSSERFAVAVDLGTTTLAAELIDLADGTKLAIASRMNSQVTFGDDVLSRIRFARDDYSGLSQMQQAVIAAVSEMITELIEAQNTSRERIYEVFLSGNTTMQQIFLGLDVRPLGEAPFVTVTNEGVSMHAAQLGLNVHPRAAISTMPVIGGFVGGDTVSGILATGMVDEIGNTLLIDIGTNGELAIWSHGQLMAASTAAGPAFEGARISQGMRGTIGAIERVLVDEKGLHVNVIGNVPPAGICGTGIVDLTAELLRTGVLLPSGKLLGPDKLPKDLMPDLVRRVTTIDSHPAFILATAKEAESDRPIVVTQQDFRELQLATGAIRAGIQLLLEHVNLAATDLEHIFIAGGFGNFIRRSNAQRIGLLPQEVDRHRILYRGNTSLMGARLCAISKSCRAKSDAIAELARHIDLSRLPNFADVYAESMIFPES
ncbi:MAG: ASKHA domain-containing protein [Planctomycetia bacterium]|jgi:uncharacterized 2Fe-2S/4Fe-4S cluster protein (DUF4445 family)